MNYDAIIIGSGPAGAAAAISLAGAGRSVLVLEQSRHPRHKSCGGGLSARLLPYLDEDVGMVLEEEISKVTFTFKEKRVTVPSNQPIAYLVKRPRFDAYLADKARRAGAEVREVTPMRAWRRTPEGVEVQSRAGWDRASFLIGADGANSRVARRLHPAWKKRYAFSVEDEARVSGGEGEVLIDLAVPKGYGWIFPKRNDAAIGIARFRGKVERPRSLYLEFLSRARLPFRAAPCGSPIPLWRRSSFPLAQDRVLLAGDAASLVDPLFGEGIYYAVRSGQMAAKALTGPPAGSPGEVREAMEAYDREIRSTFYPEFETAERIAGWLYAFPRLFLEAARRYPDGMRLYYDVLRGERSYCAFWKEVRKTVLRKSNLFRYIFEASSRP